MNLKYLLIIIQSKSDIQWHILDSSYINFINQIVIVKIIKLCDHDSFVPNITLLGLESIMNTPNITIYISDNHNNQYFFIKIYTYLHYPVDNHYWLYIVQCKC